MKLKQIQLQGFKSFVNRTVLNFRDSITVIVGPNGCGKSNVVDAIRWAMGEMSAKQLRGESMEDVIFHGSEDIPGVGLAEVTLVFDNSAGLAPGELSRFSEIQVTRRLFRDGESEYYLNRTPCRLKDITDLFLGSGAGTRAYSIVEQGRIEEIITMKADQRRILIEEAAGVSKYRVRKVEAERKMEATRQNLVRLRDIIAELKRQMNSLNRQAKKAERFKECRDRLKEVELLLAAGRGRKLLQEEEETMARKAELDNRFSSLSTALEVEEADLEKKRLELADQERILSASRLQSLQAQQAVEKEENALTLLGREQENLQAARLRLAEEREQILLRLQELEREAAELTEQTRGLQAETENAEQAVKQAESARAWKEKECRELQQEIDLLEKNLKEMKAGWNQSRQNLERASWKKQEAEEKRGQAEQKRRLLEQTKELQARTNLSLNEKIYQLRKSLAEQKERSTAAEAAVADLQTRRAVIADRVQDLDQRHERLASRLESLREMERNLEGYARGVKAVMARKAMLEAQGKNGTYGLLTDLIKVDREYELALEAVLGERLQSVVVKSRRHGLENIQFLREQAAGRSSFVPVEGSGGGPVAVPEPLRALGAEPLSEKVQVPAEYAPVTRALIGSALVVDDLEAAALTREQTGAANPLVTRDGLFLDERGVLIGGSQDSFSGLLAKKREIGELEKNLGEIVQQRQTTKDELWELDRQIQEKTHELEEIKERLLRLEIDKNNLEKDLRHGTDAFNAIQEESRSLVEEEESTTELILDLDTAIRQAAAEMEETQNTFTQLETRLQDLKEQLQKRSEERDAEIDHCSLLNTQLAVLQERSETAEKQRRRLLQTRGELGAGIARCEKEEAETALRAQGLLVQTEEREVARRKAVQVAKELHDAAEQKAQEFAAAAEALRLRESGLKELRKEREAVKDRLMEAELKLSELRQQFAGLAESLQDKYSRDLREVVAETAARSAEIPPPEELAAEREQLRERLSRMGDVNLTALEEFEEISQRHSFLANQEADLLSALENLELTIGKINATYRKAFKTTFEEVNEKFKQIFPRLFNGGSATLQLTSDDVLEAGIEILAQPPGKRMNHIALLSGGEKALTATALILALFQVKPSPFCLLDEVDAALDDANIVRFNELVQELAADSQLIIITHNRKTMEIAQAIYGVTMEQKGVSRIISVRFKQEKEEQEQEPDAA